jgi:uncharacterized protein YbcI
MKTQGEIEAAICQGVSRFQHDNMGRGPKDIRTYLINDLLVLPLQWVLIVAKQQLVKSPPAKKARDLLKRVTLRLIECGISVCQRFAPQ